MGLVIIDRVKVERKHKWKINVGMQAVLWVNDQWIWGDIRHRKLWFDVRIGVSILPADKEWRRKVKNSQQILWKKE